jgi:NADH-quinone oxidoreductase subunit M
MQFPVLSVIVFTPIIAAIIILLIPSDRKTETRVAALAAATFALGLSVWVYFSYDVQASGYQFVEKYAWLPQFGISYFVGVDGMSAPLVLLAGLVMFTGVLISWGLDDRPREFFAFLFILATGVFGVFVALDLFMLFFFYEIAVFPMYLLIAIWGWKVTREYAAMKLTLYLFIGSVIALVGALGMYYASGLGTFDMIALEGAGFSVAFQKIVFPFVFFGFAILGGIFPFHNWSPDGHVAAPTAVSMFHAGVLMKLGAFAALRVGIMLLPEGAKFHMSWIIILTLVNVVYGAFIAFVQTDFKYVIGFSSVSHMGLVLMGFATLTSDGLLGAGVTHTREIPKLGGVRLVMPVVTIAFIVGGLVSMGMPGFSGFVAEFPIFMGLWDSYPWIAWVAVISIVITAAYIIRIIGKVFFGKIPEEFKGHLHDVRVLDKVALVLLSAILIIVGIYPTIMVPMVQSGVENVLRLLGGA